MTTMTFEESVTEHAEVRPLMFWVNALEGWMPLAQHFTGEGDIAQAEFYIDLVDSALWLIPQLARSEP